MSDNVSNFILVGLPETGKSTFLAALDMTLEAQADPNGLRSDSFAADRSYLQLLQTAWLKGTGMPRTNSAQASSIVRLRARDPLSNTVAELYLPDILGETFTQQFEQREWSVSFRNQLASLTGILLFITCHKSASEPTIATIPGESDDGPATNPGESHLALEANNAEISQPKAIVQPILWHPKFTDAQDKVVDLLQFISSSNVLTVPLKVAVIISAWDVAIKAAPMIPQEPSKYVQQQWPLLGQYLSSNPEIFSFKCFGVSARGGGPEDTAALVQLSDPTDRIKLVEDNHNSKDLTRPIRWLLNLP